MSPSRRPSNGRNELVVLLDCFELVATFTPGAANTERAIALLGLRPDLRRLVLARGSGPAGQAQQCRARPVRHRVPPANRRPAGLGRLAAAPVDHLFVSFNTSLAFSSTSTVILSIRAKILSLLQASIAIFIVAVVAARVVNTIQ